MGVYDDASDPPHDELPNLCDIFKSVDERDPPGRAPTQTDLHYQRMGKRDADGAARGEGQRRRWGRRRA